MQIGLWRDYKNNFFVIILFDMTLMNKKFTLIKIMHKNMKNINIRYLGFC